MLKSMKRKNNMRFIASLIVLTFLITSFNFQYVLATKIETPVTEVRELTELANENTTVYLNSDGTKTAYIYDKPIRYKDKEGKLIDIDNSIEEITQVSDKANHKYKNKSNKFDVVFPESVNSDEFINLNYNGYELGFRPKRTLTKESSPAEKIGYKEKPEKTAKLKYKDVFEKGVELNYSVIDAGIKEDIILTKQPTSNIFEFELKTPGIIPEKTDDNKVLLKKMDTGEVIGVIPRPFMYDSSEQEKYSETIEVELTKGETENILLHSTINHSKKIKII